MHILDPVLNVIEVATNFPGQIETCLTVLSLCSRAGTVLVECGLQRIVNLRKQILNTFTIICKVLGSVFCASDPISQTAYHQLVPKSVLGNFKKFFETHNPLIKGRETYAAQTRNAQNQVHGT